MKTTKNINEAMRAQDELLKKMLKEIGRWSRFDPTVEELSASAREVDGEEGLPPGYIEELPDGRRFLTGGFIAREPVFIDAPEWAPQAAEWLRHRAIKQSRINDQYPEHVACYPSWQKKVSDLIWLAEDLDRLVDENTK